MKPERPKGRRESPRSSSGIHRTPPHSSEAEQCLLGSMLILPNETIGRFAERVTAEMFYVPAHQIIFEALLKAWQGGAVIDLVTFTQILRDRSELEAVGGPSFVTALYSFVPTAANAEYYFDIVRDKFFLRQVIEKCTEMVRRSSDEQDDVEAIVREMEMTLFELSERATTRTARKTAKELVAEVMDNLSDPEKAFGISTGFTKLNALVGGLAPAAKIVIAGGTSSGKSSLAHNIADSVAVERGIPVAVFTFEMTGAQTIQRMIQTHAEVSARDIVRGDADAFLFNSFTKAAARIAESPLHVIDERLDVAGIRARCMQLKASAGLRVAIVDYLQIIPEQKQKGESRTEQLDRMSMETKQIAKNLGITIIELSQVTALEGGGSRTRGSSGIQNDADQVWFIETDEDDPGTKTIVVAKQRDGDQGTVEFRWNKTITRFREK